MNHTSHIPFEQEYAAPTTAPDARSDFTPGQIGAAYLKQLDQDGVHQLVAIDPSRGALKGKTFQVGEFDAVAAWVDSLAGAWNLYFTLNEVRSSFAGTKPTKEDIVKIRGIGVDVDPPAGSEADVEVARAEIRESLMRFGSPRFTSIWDTGGGYQAVLLVDQKIDATSDTVGWAEEHGRGLAHLLGGDSTQNIERLYRLPGPDNVPTPAKAANGRVRRAANVVRWDGDRVAPATISQAIVPLHTPVGSEERDDEISEVQRDLATSGYECCSNYAELPEELRSRFDADLEKNAGLRRLWREGHLKSADKTGSAYRFSLAGWLKRVGGYSADDFASLANVWDNAVQLGDDRDAKLTPRALARDWVRSGRDTSSGADLRPEDHFAPIAEAETTSTSKNSTREPKRVIKTLTFDEAVAGALTQNSLPLVRGLIDQEAMSVVYGPSNVGKTFVVVDMAFHIACGVPWAGHSTTKSKVLYIAAEGGKGILRRLAALKQRYPDLSGENFHLMPASVDLRSEKGDTQAVIDTVEHLGGGFGLVVVDTLSRVLNGGDENGPVDMGAFNMRMDSIRRATGAHVLVVHHAGKDIAKGARGHTSLRAATDTEIELREGVFEVTKQRDLERGPGLEFKIIGTIIGIDVEGEPVRSATVSVRKPSKAKRKKPTPAEENVLDALRHCEAQQQDEDGLGIRTSDVARRASKSGRKISPEGARKSLERLRLKGLVDNLGAGKWAIRTECHGLSALDDTSAQSDFVQPSGQQVDKSAGVNTFG
ncbi:MAG: helicase RepA family protein [Pseudomonadota bacterium]|nr:helicase RepA family protein [Pseudomonadota bacterium]